MVIRCAIRGCKTVGDSGFHSFPSDKQRCSQWITITKTHQFDPQTLPKSFRKICRRHFQPSDYEDDSTKLKKNAVPSLHLPDKFSVFDEYTKACYIIFTSSKYSIINIYLDY